MINSKLIIPKIYKYTYKKPFKGNTENLSKLFFLAAPEYELILKKIKIKKNILFNRLLNKKNSELESFYVLKKNKRIIGFISLFPSEEIFNRKLKTFLIIKKLISLYKHKFDIKRYMIDIKNIKKSTYISRIVIAKQYRNKGMANFFLKKISKLKEVKIKKIISLHVEKKNKNAINFYLSNKFFLAQKSKKVCLMYKIND